MAQADHVYVSHGWYTHHGIDLGDGTVVHLSRAAGRVTRVPWDEFSSGRSVFVHEWPAADDPRVVIERAVSSVGKSGYDLVEGNCEHFASWCKSGSARSLQVTRLGRQVAAVGGRWAARQVVKQAAHVSGKSLLRSVSPALLAVDAAQLGTELWLTHRGVPAQRAEAAGASVGLVGSLAVGTALAGPVGACVGVALWAAGEIVGRRATADL